MNKDGQVDTNGNQTPDAMQGLEMAQANTS